MVRAASDSTRAKSKRSPIRSEAPISSANWASSWSRPRLETPVQFGADVQQGQMRLAERTGGRSNGMARVDVGELGEPPAR